MKPSQLSIAIRTCIEADQPLLIEGPPGTGKSRIVGQTVALMNRELLDERVSDRDPVEICGLYQVVDGKTKRSRPEFMPEDDGKEYVLFLDEISTAVPLTQAVCFPAKTPVIGHSIKNIEDIATGDAVIDHEGRTRNVSSVMRRGYSGDLVEVKARSFLPVEATPEHPILVIDKFTKENREWGRRRNVSSPRWVNVGDLQEGQYVGMPILKPSTCEKEIVIQRQGNMELRLPLTSDFARFCGYYAGDGYASNGRIGIAFHRSQKEWAADVESVLRDTFGLSPTVRGYRYTQGTHDVGCGFAPLAKFLKVHCGGNVAEKRIPHFILFHTDRELLRQFLIGFWRADGHMTSSESDKGSVGFTTISRTLAFQTQQAFGRFGILISIQKKEAGTQTTAAGKSWNYREAYRLTSRLNAAHALLDLTIPAKERPTEHFFEHDDRLWAKISSIRRRPFSGTVYNCEIEGSHTYQASNIAVHNCLQLVLDRRVGPHKLPKNCAIVAAANRLADGALVQRMSSAFRDRFTKVELETDLEDWCSWAITVGVDPSVIGFLRERTELLHKFDKNQSAWPSPRGWEFVSKIITMSPPKSVERDLIEGTVGTGAAVEYIAFLERYRDLPPIDDILKDPKGAPVPKDPSLLYALSSGLSYRADPKTLQQIIDYTERIPTEYRILSMTFAIQRTKELKTCPPFVKWAVRYQDFYKDWN